MEVNLQGCPNTEVLYINSEENILVLKGSVPGKKNTMLKIQSQKY